MKSCARCGSPLWSGHVCPAAPISERVPQITSVAVFAWREDKRVAKRILEVFQ